MNRRQTRMLSVAFVLLVTAMGAVHADQTPLAFGIFPRWNAQITVRDFTPLATFLGQELGRPVRIETDKDFDSFMHRVYARKFDLVHLNQLQYVQAHQKAGYRAIAKMCDNASCTIRAAIVTRRDTAISNVADLRGRIIAFADPGAMVSHVLAKSLLREQGLKPAQYSTIFARNPPNALLAVYNAEADAAGVGESVLQREEIKRLIDLNQLRILAQSRPIPHLPIAVSSDLDGTIVQRVQQILTGLAKRPEGRRILGQIGIDRFEAADDRDYAVVRKLSRDGDAD
ncbi:MAG: phosphate/phosphite/phosphonate ABC transporter substrate-binding protein [Gammaproteobacteria bacterium]|nr:phosphate/phosphite/phosphonate ABC transporter substrate-binding protein [Gammaproteobacteria bacterium]